MKLSDKLNEAKEKYQSLKAQHKQVTDEIKESIKYSCHTGGQYAARNAICLYYGEFASLHSMRHLPNQLKISPASKWNSKDKCQEFSNYYNLHKVYGGIIDEYRKEAGFACELKHLPEALSYELEDMWLYHINENRYRSGLLTFKAQIQSKDIDLLKLFKQYHSRNSSIIELMHRPRLGISNIVLFIK